MTRTAAFFDFDRTLIAADSQREEALSLVRKHRPSLLYPFRLLKVVAAEPFYKKNLIDHDRYNRIYLTSYKGIPLARLQAHAENLYKTQLKPLLFQEMLARMEAHRSRGHLIIVVSATSSHLIEPFIEECSPDAWVATPIETNDNGICTGRPDSNVCVGREKARAMERIAERLDISLETSHAYSDHHADLEFLEAVGHPTVVNPTPLLAEIANERGWQVKRVP
ncbi:morphological differentiation-associated protein [Desulfoluna limicola]|uniref:Morphological differentiation-associated protein n=1 Tax=Desulfoluna limicola TaxID=2810562 RepID=A0ABM7PHH2_9BACT|nr:HAD-IB family hydrolase [Desulfoluna limicola]BCS96574.1 morphological differentiation-associated protein [Desulfoluna limicola]